MYSTTCVDYAINAVWKIAMWVGEFGVGLANNREGERFANLEIVYICYWQM